MPDPCHAARVFCVIIGLLEGFFLGYACCLKWNRKDDSEQEEKEDDAG